MVGSVGIDISGVQPAEVPGDWLFVVVKTTEGLSVVNPLASQQWAFAQRSPFRGLYHYARPHPGAGALSGLAQAKVFADDALTRGFRKGVDLVQLDCEQTGNENVSSADWSAFVPAFMDSVLARLGALSFVYVGRFFHADVFGPLVQHGRYNWWLPDYGPNNGQVHPLAAGVLPVIHQYSSAGGLDRNVIANPAAWSMLTHGAFTAEVPKVRQEFYPPGQSVSLTVFTHPSLGECAAELNADGGVFCDPPGAYLGGVNGLADFAGRTPAEIRRPNTAEQAKGWHTGYVIVATSGETYKPVVPAK